MIWLKILGALVVAWVLLIVVLGAILIYQRYKTRGERYDLEHGIIRCDTCKRPIEVNVDRQVIRDMRQRNVKTICPQCQGGVGL